MILDLILNIVAFLITGVATILPTFSIFPSGIATNIQTISAEINGWSWLFPVNTIFQVLAILVLLVFAEFTYFVAMYVLSIIHASIRG